MAEDQAYWFREYDTATREKYAKSGVALPDGSFPIPDVAALHDAMQSIGRAKDQAEAKAHIRSRAKALGAEDQLTDAFKASEPDTSDVHVNAPVNSELQTQRPTWHFLTRLRDRLKGKISSTEFDEAVRHARGYAGGKTRAENRQVSTMGSDWAYSPEGPGDESAYLADSALADTDGDNDADDMAQPKLEKADKRVNYREAKALGETCGDCRFFCEDDGACRIVEGFIRSDGVCDLQSPLVTDFNEPQIFTFGEPLVFMQPPEWIPYLPKPGSYKHPSYGQVVITPERNQRFVSNFKTAVYQEELPIDAEHQSKLSGACGYVTDMRMNGDGSVDAKPRWTDRGTALLAADRFTSFSPEFYDEWTDPATGHVHKDVAIGGALTTRPFFKSKSLRPLAASEHVLVGWFAPREQEQQMAEATHPFDGDHSHEHAAYDGADDNGDGQHTHEHSHSDDGNHEHTHTGAMMANESGQAAAATPQNYAEQIDKLQRENAALRLMTEGQASEQKRMAEVIDGMAKDARTKQFTDEVLGRGEASSARWYGEVERHVEFMETLHEAGLEDQLTQYIEQNRTHAEQLRTSGLFSERGRAGTSGAKSAEERLMSLVAAEEAEGTPPAEAMDKVMRENPQLYVEYSDAKSFNDGDRG